MAQGRVILTVNCSNKVLTLVPFIFPVECIQSTEDLVI